MGAKNLSARLMVGLLACGYASQLWAAPGDRVFVGRGGRFEAPPDLFAATQMLPTPNGTSALWTSDHALTLIAGTLPADEGNEAAALRAEFAKRAKSKNVSYKVQKDNWFVVSGKTKDERDRESIFYIRVIQGPAKLVVLKAVYADSQKGRLNPIVAGIMKSFAPLAQGRCDEGGAADKVLWELPEMKAMIDRVHKDLHEPFADPDGEAAMTSACKFKAGGKEQGGGRSVEMEVQIVPETQSVWITDDACDVEVPLDQWRAGKHGNKKQCYEADPGPSMDLRETGLD